MAKHEWKKNNGDVDDFAGEWKGADGRLHRGPICETCSYSFCVDCERRKKGDKWNSDCPGEW